MGRRIVGYLIALLLCSSVYADDIKQDYLSSVDAVGVNEEVRKIYAKTDGLEEDIATNATAIEANATNIVPAGCIVLWSGSEASIPSGWVLCDGTNGTPDLRNSFVMGAGDTYAVDATGGSLTITEANMPSHTHSINHTNSTEYYALGGGGDAKPVYDANNGGATNFNSNAFSGTSGSTGSGTDYLQPYYALCYIMKS